jgi:hypothetical protein
MFSPDLTSSHSEICSSRELLAVAKRIFWFGTPEEALEFPLRFLTYAMTYASDQDIQIIRKYFSALISKRHWITLHLGFSIKLRGSNGMNGTAVHPFHHFQSDGFRA